MRRSSLPPGRIWVTGRSPPATSKLTPSTRRGRACAPSARRPRADPVRARVLRQQPRTRYRRARGYHAHLRAIDAAAALGGVPSARSSAATPAAASPRISARPSVSFRRSSTMRGARGRLMIENCVMEGWHPDGYPGNLAYSPELWEWMFELGLYLNFDPSHLLWLGIDPIDALRPYVDRVVHAHTKDAETFPAERNRYGFFGRTSTREEDPWDMGWWRYRIPGLGQVDFRRYVDTLYEGGFDGVLSVEHEDPGVGRHARVDRGRASDRPQQSPAAWSSSEKGPRDSQSGEGVSGRQGASGCRPRRPRGRGALPARRQRRRQVDAHQVCFRRTRADERRNPLRR